MILSAEDDDDYFLLLETILKSQLHVDNVCRVSNGEELIDYLKKCLEGDETAKWPNVIFLDLNMPKKNGHEALQEIRSNPNFPRMVIIILSVSTDDKDIEKSYSLGADSFITKPTSLMDLVWVLKKALDRWGTP